MKEKMKSSKSFAVEALGVLFLADDVSFGF